MNCNLENNIFITDLDDIFGIMDQASQVFLYDTVAISNHEHAFHHYGYHLLKDFIGDASIVITDTIYQEMKIGEEVGARYLRYLREFNRVILIKEEQFFDFFDQMFTPKLQAINRFRICSTKAFEMIQPLAEKIEQLNEHNARIRVIELFKAFFVSGKNKGEYSLFWLSLVLKTVFPRLYITFIGADRDLYNIVSYYLNKQKVHVPTRIINEKIEIISNDSMLQALIRLGKDVDELCRVYRNEERKLLHKEIILGITSQNIKDLSIKNELFIEKIKQQQIEVLY